MCINRALWAIGFLVFICGSSVGEKDRRLPVPKLIRRPNVLKIPLTPTFLYNVPQRNAKKLQIPAKKISQTIRIQLKTPKMLSPKYFHTKLPANQLGRNPNHILHRGKPAIKSKSKEPSSLKEECLICSYSPWIPMKPYSKENNINDLNNLDKDNLNQVSDRRSDDYIDEEPTKQKLLNVESNTHITKKNVIDAKNPPQNSHTNVLDITNNSGKIQSVKTPSNVTTPKFKKLVKTQKSNEIKNNFEEGIKNTKSITKFKGKLKVVKPRIKTRTLKTNVSFEPIVKEEGNDILMTKELERQKHMKQSKNKEPEISSKVSSSSRKSNEKIEIAETRSLPDALENFDFGPFDSSVFNGFTPNNQNIDTKFRPFNHVKETRTKVEPIKPKRKVKLLMDHVSNRDKYILPSALLVNDPWNQYDYPENDFEIVKLKFPEDKHTVKSTNIKHDLPYKHKYTKPTYTYVKPTYRPSIVKAYNNYEKPSHLKRHLYKPIEKQYSRYTEVHETPILKFDHQKLKPHISTDTFKTENPFFEFELNHGLGTNNRKHPKFPKLISYGFKNSYHSAPNKDEDAYYYNSLDKENIFHQTSPEKDTIMYSTSPEQENSFYQTSQEEDNIFYSTPPEENNSFYQDFPQFETLKVSDRPPIERKGSDIHSQSFGPENFPSHKRDRARFLKLPGGGHGSKFVNDEVEFGGETGGYGSYRWFADFFVTPKSQ